MAYRQNDNGIWAPEVVSAGQIRESYPVWDGETTQLAERLAALELALDSVDWRLLTAQSEHEFSRDGLRQVTELARIMYLKNPLIRRGVSVKRLYVWGGGVSVMATTPEIQEVLDAFHDDERNRAELTSHQAHGAKEIELQTDANLFFVFFTNLASGAVRVRSIPFNQIEDVICNPDDAKEPWFYRRVWSERRVNLADGAENVVTQAAYYPDWLYTPQARPARIGSVPVQWDSPVYHVKVGGFSDWKFGLSEIYDAIDWARAYKEFLEDWASIVRAYRRFAFQLTTTGGKSGIAAAKSKLSTTLGSGGVGGESNPAPVVGSTFISGEGTNITPVRTSGATVSAEDGRRLLLMVAASFGLPETFFGDASVGTLATAKSLDRPTELAMQDRRTFWGDVFQRVYEFVLRAALKAPGHPLRSLGRVVSDTDGDEVTERIEWNEGVDATILIDWPPLLEADATASVSAIVSAATLDGKPLAGTFDLPTVARMLLVALGDEDVDATVARLFPEGQTAAQPAERAVPQAEALMVEAVRELRDRLEGIQA